MLILPEERANLRRATFKASAYYSAALQGVENVSEDVKTMKVFAITADIIQKLSFFFL